MTDHAPEHRATTETPPAMLGIVEHVLADHAISGELTALAGNALGPYRKLLFQLAAPAVTLLLVVLGGHVTLVQILTAVVGLLTTAAVYRFPNTERARATKAVFAFASAGVQAVLVLLVGGLAIGDVSPDQWIGVVVQALAAIGVLVAPNDPEPAPLPAAAADPAPLPAASR